jgi:DNA-directed RNA polymerase beta subunit
MNHTLMGPNMQCQAIPLFKLEKCIVENRLEGQASLDSGSVAIATQEGRIEYLHE